ncbi:MAG TPA: RNA methyltransferase [Thermomicrobiales bacterium]|nr:RNA methyltransferase [Thermomicrobiales bacterium]
MPRTVVSSTANPTIKRIVALRDRRAIRYAERRFIVEGPRFVWDSAFKQPPELLVGTATALDAWEIDPAQEVLEVSDELFQHISTTDTPQGILGVFVMPEVAIPEGRTPLIVLADGIQDPGNLGTLIRSAVAFGATEVIALRGTVDPFSPKVVRAAAGAHFLIRISAVAPDDLSLVNVQLVLADEDGSVPPAKVAFRKPTAVAVGGEARGISDALRTREHVSVAIPMMPALDSLNAGVAISVLLYEADRQRRAAGA